MSAENSEHDVAVTSPTWNRVVPLLADQGLWPDTVLPPEHDLLHALHVGECNQPNQGPRGVGQLQQVLPCHDLLPVLHVLPLIQEAVKPLRHQAAVRKELCAKFCFALGNYFQMLDHILVKEGYTWRVLWQGCA